MRFTPALSARFEDQDQERWRRNVDERIAEIQALPMVGGVVLAGVELEDGVETFVAHKLGRKPVMAWPSFVRNATSTGRIVHGDTKDPAKYLVLTASGWGATITIDIGVI